MHSGSVSLLVESCHISGHDSHFACMHYGQDLCFDFYIRS